jgi:hypothetical protein
LVRTHKLVLLLDFDDTLVSASALAPATGVDDVVVHMATLNRTVVPRPHLVDFLWTMSNMYEVYICSLGEREYVQAALRLLVPDADGAVSGIYGREDFPTLVKRLPEGIGSPWMAVIVDDRRDVWIRELRPNQITIRPFHMFGVLGDRLAAPDVDDHLLYAAEKLHKIHGAFFSGGLHSVTSAMLASQRMSLHGVSLHFYGVETRKELRSLISGAMALGAKCTKEFDPKTTTYVVFDSIPSERDLLSMQHPGVALVSMAWLLTAVRTWSNPPADAYKIRTP